MLPDTAEILVRAPRQRRPQSSPTARGAATLCPLTLFDTQNCGFANGLLILIHLAIGEIV